jgi:hypothetical protein
MTDTIKRFINEMLTNPNRTFRKNAVTDTIEGVTIDTCYAPDTLKWETAIMKGETLDEIVVVEIYSSEVEAIKGHDKWCDKVRKNTKQKFKKCINALQWALGDY